MKKLNFNSTEEFESLFSGKNKKREVTDAIVEGIEEAMKFNKTSAPIFLFTFSEAEIEYEMSLPQDQWITALQACLEHYEELELTDECIDTWKLIEVIKFW